MNKNTTDKLIFLMVIAVFLIAVFVGVYLITYVISMSYEMGIMAEKIGTLEELIPLKPGK